VANAKKAPRELYDWMITLPGVKEACAVTEAEGKQYYNVPQGNVFFNLKNYDDAIGPGHGGSFLVHMMVQQFPRLGIELLTNHRAVEIKTDADGKVCGVVAQDPGGVTEIRCKAVVCASGGFAHNDELLKKYWPWFFSENPDDEPVHRFAVPTNTGDVVPLGESAGAYLDYDSFFVNLFGPVHHPFSFVLFQYCLQPDSIKVNLDGKRFFNDSNFADGAAYIHQQPGRVAWSIYDNDMMENLAQRMAAQRGGAFADYKKELDAEIALDTPCKKADTLEDLAKQCGIAVEPFLETIRRYNEFCKNGVDEDFGRKPLIPIQNGPFYAIYGKMATDGAFGGMLINGKTEVYKADKSGVIPGLYATGDNASGWAKNPGKPGDNRMMVTGEMMWASGSGFIAGTNAAEYIK
jgi:fumarate reductase flavoprotein subunit